MSFFNKPTTIILYLIWLIAPSFTNAQDLNEILVTHDFRNEPVTEVITTLSKEYSINIYFKTEWFTNKTFIGSFNQARLMVVLDKVLSGTNVSYITIQNSIYLVSNEQVALLLGQMINLQNNDSESDKNEELITVGDPNQIGKHKKIRISGVVKDGAIGETLIGATIAVENTTNYAVSGYTGDYSLELTPGTYNLIISSVGYEERKLGIKAVGPGTLDIELFETSHEINEVVVHGDKADRNIRNNQMSIVEMDSKSIKQLPSLIGEKDILKSFTLMPGVKSVGEFGSGINVRGGGDDQNLYLLEGTPVFNTSHVMGLLSVINPDAVTNIKLYKGHILPEFGERVSSVMDIKVDHFEINRFKLTGGIGLFSSRLLVETPIINKKITVKLGARSSYTDFLLTKIPDYYLMNSSASFYDFTGMVNINLKNNPITLFGYYSYDYFKYAGNFSYNYGNRLASMNWIHIFNPNLSSSALFSYSNYAISRNDIQDELFASNIKSDLNYLSGKLKFEYSGLSNQQIESGIQGINYQINPGKSEPINQSQSQPFMSEEENGYEFSFFLNDLITLTRNLSVQAGFRYTLYYYTGPQTVYSYLEGKPRILSNQVDSTIYQKGDIVSNYHGIEPRLSLKYMLDENSSVKISYNKNRQYMSLLSYTSISTPEDVWKLADPYLKPITCNQMALGYYRNLKNNRYETSAEVYYKQLKDLTEYRNGAVITLNNHIETELLNATGTNYGIEFLIKKNAGKFTGSFTYTYSRAFKQTHGVYKEDKINNNTVYPSSFDKPHDLNVNINFNANRRIRLGANFTYSTGRPITLPEYVFNSGANQLVYYSDRNKYRLPDYHRLDLSVSFDESLKRGKKWKGSWTLSVLNVYARKNAYSVFYKRDTPTKDNNYELFSLYKMYLIGIPLPTLTYNFTF